MTDEQLAPKLTEHGVPYYELTQQFELYKFKASKFILGQQLFWASNLAGYVSVAFVCPFCGKLWARRRFLRITKWAVLLRPCEAHGDGSLLDQSDFNRVDDLPRELMKYELSIFNGD